MNKTGRQSFFTRLLHWRFLFFLNAILVVLLGVTFGREFLHDREIQKEITKLQAQADDLTSRNVSLGQLQTAIQTQSFIEREARLKLGMKKIGEEAVVIQQEVTRVDKEGQGGTVSETDLSDPLNLVLDEGQTSGRVANPTKWWYYFFRKSVYQTLVAYER